MNKTLGKILILTIAVALHLSAGVKATVNAPAVYKGDSVNLTISAEGDKVLFPEIDAIDLNPINGTSSSQSTTIINGDVSRQVSKVYSFTPQKSLTIPPYEVNVDGKTYKTKAIKVSVLKPTASKKGEPFMVEMHVDKKEAYVGESIDLTISFKQKLDAHADKLQLGEPKLENFWVKKEQNVQKSNEGDYIVQTIHYRLFPQKEGNYTINPIEADIGTLTQRRRGIGTFQDSFFNDPFFDAFGQRLKWKKIFSNQLNLHIKPLPENLELFGDFEISASVDKKSVHANKPLNLTIMIKGEGNIDDIKKFDLDIDNAIVYADEPKISSQLVNGVYQGEFTQKISIIADSNFTVPSISLKYFDKTSQAVKTIHTKPIEITVVGGGKALSKPTIEVSQKSVVQAPNKSLEKEKVVTYDEKSYIKYLFLLAGILLGGALSYIFTHLKKQDVKKPHDIIKSIKKAKTDRALFDLLLAYSKKGKVVSDALAKLEENIYKNRQHKIDKDALMDFFEEEEEKARV